MPDGITEQNKDVMMKVLAENYKDKSFKVLGLDLPKIKEFIPTQFPDIMASEIRADNIFLLEDGRILIVDYESDIKKGSDYIKYLGYIYMVQKNYFKSKGKVYNVIMAVIYTGDIKSTDAYFDYGSIQVCIEQVFLSNFDTDELYDGLKRKIEAGEALSDEDAMRFIILPLTESRKKKKQDLIEKTIDLAKRIADEEQQVFVIAGILVATDKFIDREYSNMIKRWIMMTKVGRLFEEEKIEYANQLRQKDKIDLVKEMLTDGVDIIMIMKYSKLTKDEILRIRSELNLPDAI